MKVSTSKVRDEYQTHDQSKRSCFVFKKDSLKSDADIRPLDQKSVTSQKL